MPRYKDDPPAVRVYTVCDESRYLIVRNVPALGCGDDLLKLFANYGDVEECKPMDAEDCKQFIDVYWIEFQLISNARFAKRKLDDFVFLGNHLQEESRVVSCLNLKSCEAAQLLSASFQHIPDQKNYHRGSTLFNFILDAGDSEFKSHSNNAQITRVSSDKDCFPSQSMNQTVKTVRDKLNKIQSDTEHLQAGLHLRKQE
ncbi:hypothetical protein CXB51_016550 [Gossypium anomalum]|uniref:RNA-binding protein 48 n=1 Tax=Gossypium anomalum TaxID=47600 RepID=A0A8J5Z471_9ROSI|nr:hypothetical protein CXB51_016550 [Gossypium anomalum]